MAQVHVQAAAAVAAPVERVYALVADYRQHHPRILPPDFSDLQVEHGGVGAGTVISFTLKLGGRRQHIRQQVSEPQPGRVLSESDIGGREAVTTWTIAPEGPGSRVRIETVWEARGLQGVVERLLAPRLLRRLYRDELDRLDQYARRA